MNILLLEEHITDAFEFHQALSRTGYLINLTTVHSISELNLFVNNLTNNSAKVIPELIFLDAHLPDTETREMIDFIHSAECLSETSIYMLTTSKAERDMLKSYNLEVVDFIVKPITSEKLSSILERVAAGLTVGN